MKPIEIPTELGEALVRLAAHIDESVKPTGKTRHFVAGTMLGPFRNLAICQLGDSAGYYLFYCDAEWNILADTWHQSIEDAKHQAEFEYEGIAGNWIRVS